MKFKNKKADLSEGILFVVIIFFLAVSFLVVGYANSLIQDVIQTTVLNQSDASDSIIDGLNYINTTGINNAYIFLFVGMIIAMMLSSFLVRVHPAFLFLYIITTAIAGLLAILLTNAWDKIITNNILASQLTNYPAMTWIMSNSLKITLGAVILSIIILFAKPQESVI